MSAPPRLPLADLITEFLLHSDRKHLYVEGQEDEAVLKWFLEPDIDVDNRLYAIDCIEISAKMLSEYGLTDGQKSRLIVLARELGTELPSTVNPALCIVDADFDYLLDALVDTRFLTYTDGTSLDMYAFTEPALERVIRLGLRDSYASPNEILNSLFGVLKDVFVIRAANVSLQLGLEWLAFEGRCRIQPNGTVEFDRNKFVRDYLGKNGALNKYDDFLRRVNELEAKDLELKQRWIRGHDFSKLLSKYLRSTIKSRVAKRSIRGDVIDRMLFVALDRKQLEREPLFQRIEEFLRH